MMEDDYTAWKDGHLLAGWILGGVYVKSMGHESQQATQGLIQRTQTKKETEEAKKGAPAEFTQ